ncbi:MAG: integrase [Gammaproteobacteria bacterium CG_4_10_14_0_8_um_filter_38_16]|nr:MAG: integrase [Gammaproteobacteria bacterium CG_4_10_14_0_8_um_filter_38_16]PJA04164.1 MAG: integrase [Gammaproteobacteria bacterium CG_4_10_14_0_2_um_filter_38_22]PJB10105.1 MAG: integrase [Gammaproteobacteria bacterium CG_4_9_14_3_um_filter_38_9]
MALTDIKIRSAKPREKAYKLTDEKGLYLFISPNGSKSWRFKYRFAGKEKLLSIGLYGDVSLADAREERDKARKLLAKDIDPGLDKQSKKRSSKIAAENSFESVAREWHTKCSSKKWTKKHAERILVRLEKDIFPYIGTKAISEIEAPELLAVLTKIEDRGAIDTAHRAHQNCNQIFRYAIATGKTKHNIAADLQGALTPVKQIHYSSIKNPIAIGELLRSINNYQGHFPTKCALQLAPLLFVRPGELRHAEWSEINFETREWKIPAKKMKMRVEHIVPLSTQAISIFKELRQLTRDGQYVFPSVRSLKRPMSDNTLNAALRRMGYTKEELTAHGFRSMASTLLNEQNWNRDVIERQLSHGERDTVRAAYNHAEYLPQRKEMMQKWADYLENLARMNIVELKVG